MANELLHIVGAGGGGGVTALATMLGSCATEGYVGMFDEVPSAEISPWVVIVAWEGVEQVQYAVALREKAIANGWKVAGIATRGIEKKRPKTIQARFIPIAEETEVYRIPHWAKLPQQALVDLPVWDFTRQDKKTKRHDGLPKAFAEVFTTIVDEVFAVERAGIKEMSAA